VLIRRWLNAIDGAAWERMELLVDDDAHVGQAMSRWRRHHDGSRVSTLEGGSSGLAARDGATFDPMIVDVSLPQMRGFERIDPRRLE
jgi:DNA-binding response OmpR family regulator